MGGCGLLGDGAPGRGPANELESWTIYYASASGSAPSPCAAAIFRRQLIDKSRSLCRSLLRAGVPPGPSPTAFQI
eukprot:3783454-Prymnesium_polylepis.1